MHQFIKNLRIEVKELIDDRFIGIKKDTKENIEKASKDI